MNIKTRVRELIKIHKGMRKAAVATGVSAGTLSKILSGQQINPTMETLKKLGLLS
jgi:DNA-binding phage protein